MTPTIFQRDLRHKRRVELGTRLVGRCQFGLREANQFITSLEQATPFATTIGTYDHSKVIAEIAGDPAIRWRRLPESWSPGMIPKPPPLKRYRIVIAQFQ